MARIPGRSSTDDTQSGMGSDSGQAGSDEETRTTQPQDEDETATDSETQPTTDSDGATAGKSALSRKISSTVSRVQERLQSGSGSGGQSTSGSQPSGTPSTNNGSPSLDASQSQSRDPIQTNATSGDSSSTAGGEPSTAGAGQSSQSLNPSQTGRSSSQPQNQDTPDTSPDQPQNEASSGRQRLDPSTTSQSSGSSPSSSDTATEPSGRQRVDPSSPPATPADTGTETPTGGPPPSTESQTTTGSGTDTGTSTGSASEPIGTDPQSGTGGEGSGSGSGSGGNDTGTSSGSVSTGSVSENPGTEQGTVQPADRKTTVAGATVTNKTAGEQNALSGDNSLVESQVKQLKSAVKSTEGVSLSDVNFTLQDSGKVTVSASEGFREQQKVKKVFNKFTDGSDASVTEVSEDVFRVEDDGKTQIVQGPEASGLDVEEAVEQTSDAPPAEQQPVTDGTDTTESSVAEEAVNQAEAVISDDGTPQGVAANTDQPGDDTTTSNAQDVLDTGTLGTTAENPLESSQASGAEGLGTTGVGTTQGDDVGESDGESGTVAADGPAAVPSRGVGRTPSQLREQAGDVNLTDAIQSVPGAVSVLESVANVDLSQSPRDRDPAERILDATTRSIQQGLQAKAAGVRDSDINAIVADAAGNDDVAKRIRRKDDPGNPLSEVAAGGIRAAGEAARLPSAALEGVELAGFLGKTFDRPGQFTTEERVDRLQTVGSLGVAAGQQFVERAQEDPTAVVSEFAASAGVSSLLSGTRFSTDLSSRLRRTEPVRTDSGVASDAAALREGAGRVRDAVPTRALDSDQLRRFVRDERAQLGTGRPTGDNVKTADDIFDDTGDGDSVEADGDQLMKTKEETVERQTQPADSDGAILDADQVEQLLEVAEQSDRDLTPESNTQTDSDTAPPSEREAAAVADVGAFERQVADAEAPEGSPGSAAESADVSTPETDTATARAGAVAGGVAGAGAGGEVSQSAGAQAKADLQEGGQAAATVAEQDLRDELQVGSAGFGSVEDTLANLDAALDTEADTRVAADLRARQRSGLGDVVDSLTVTDADVDLDTTPDLRSTLETVLDTQQDLDLRSETTTRTETGEQSRQRTTQRSTGGGGGGGRTPDPNSRGQPDDEDEDDDLFPDVGRTDEIFSTGIEQNIDEALDFKNQS